MDERRVRTFENGARLIFDPRPGSRTASLGVWVGSGARDEASAQSGLAHFLEHMAFKGAAGLSALDLAEKVESRGGVINAATEYEQTGYYVRCLSRDARLMLETALSLVFAPDHPADEVEREKGVVIQEIREGADQPEDLLGELMQQACFPDHPLGRPILGTENTLRTISREDLFEFAATTYAPSRVVLAVSGGFDEGEIEALSRSWMEAREPVPPPARTAPLRPASAALCLRRDFEQVHLAMARTASDARSPRRFADRAFSEIFGGGMASRLFQEVRERRGLAYSIDSLCDQYTDAGRHIVYVGCDAKHAREIAAITAGIWQDLAQQGPTESELARAKAVLSAGIAFAAEASAARVASAAYECLMFDRLVGIDETLQAIDTLTIEAVRQAAADAVAGPAMAASCGPAAGARAADWFVS